MKRSVFILLVLLMAVALIIPGCGKETPTPPTPPAEQPQYGGILKCAYTFGPRILGYYPEMGFADFATCQYWAEGLVNMDGKGNLIPELATSWDIDKANKTITWHLRQGVKFHDGTDWNAEAAKWTYDETIAAGRLKYGELITSIEVIDDYTLRFNLSQYNNRLVQAYGYMVCFFSPTAFNANGGKDWARDHPVGTGPFKLVEFKRDAYMKLEKFTEYWRPGRPYLDGMDIRFIPQELTALASLEAGEVDWWHGPSTATTILDLQEKGFKSGVDGIFMFFIMPDASNPDSPFANKKVREAVEYAIDREALTEALTSGLGDPLYQMAPSTSSVYDPDFPVRKYDPEKAKQLLTEAGYADGFQTTIVALQGTERNPTAIQSYLAAVGIKADLDIADMGRFMSMEFGGWKGLLLTIIAPAYPSPNYIPVYLDYLGPPPTTFAFPGFGRSPEYDALCAEVKLAQDDASERAIVQKMIKQLSEDATLIPLFANPSTPVLAPYVHPYKYAEVDMLNYSFSEWWMEKH